MRAPAAATRGPRGAGAARSPALPAVALLLLAAGLGPGDVVAQRTAAPVRIGALTESWGPTPAIVGLRDGLVALGYRENEDFVIGVRFTEGRSAELPLAARQLVERGADILVTGGGGASEAKAVRAATDRIPIVFMSGSDPVRAGLVQSLARPGANVTGVADLDVELAPKRLEIFRQLVPRLKRVLFPYDAGDPSIVSELDEYRTAASRLGVELVERPARTQAEAQAILTGVRKTDLDGILSPRYLSLNIPGFIVEAGLRYRIPTMLHASFHVEQGGLASYAADLYHIGRQAARLVDRIMKGARPADIPVERTTRFELVINRKTAAALGLGIAPDVMLRVDRFVD